MQESSSPPPPPFVNVMEKQESFAPTPVLPRLDRLDRLLQLLEEKHNLSSGRHNNICKNTVEKVVEHDDDKDDQHLQKSLSSALEEVLLKGNLVERLAMLETRVLQLSLAIDEGYASKSSPSTVEGYEKLDHGHDASSPKEKEKEKEKKEKQEDDHVLYGQGRKTHLGVHHSVCELRKKYEQFVGSRDMRKKTRHRLKHGDTGSTKWKKTKQEEGAQQMATMV